MPRLKVRGIFFDVFAGLRGKNMLYGICRSFSFLSFYCSTKYIRSIHGSVVVPPAMFPFKVINIPQAILK